MFHALVAVVALVGLSLPAIALLAQPAGAATVAANIDQCANGPVGGIAPCVNGTLGGTSYSDWVNGNVNASKAHWREGQFLPYRTTITGLSSGSHTLTFDYATVQSSKHALDYIGSYDATEQTQTAHTGSASSGNFNNNNPCFDILGTATGSGCTPLGTPPVPASTFPVPAANLTGDATCGGASHLATLPTQQAGNFALFAPTAASGTLTGASYVSQGVVSGGSNCTTTMSVTFTVSGTAPSGGWTVVLAWGGHIASSLDWGVGNSASAINGSPYHMALDSIDTTNIGSQDRALAAAAVAGPPNVATKVSKTSIGVGGSLTDTATLTGTAGTVTGTVQFQLCSNTTAGCPQGTGTNIGSPVTLVNGSATSPSFGSNLGPGNYCVGLVYVNDGNSFYSNTYSGSATNECFSVGKGTSSTATVVFDASTNAPWAGNEPTGSSAYDTSTVTGVSGFTPTGTVTYTFFTNNACSGTGASAGTVTLKADGTVPNSSTEGPLSAGSYSFQATYSGDINYLGSTSSCEPFSVGKKPTSTSTTVFDAATNAPWSGTEKTGASAYDTATVGGKQGGITPSGTVTYTFFTNGSCSGGGTGAGTVTLTAAGAVPNSNTESTLAAGSYSFQATYSGDNNYSASTSPCEPFSVGGGSSQTATVVFDASTNAPWAGTETTGSSAYDTASVSTSDTIIATGTVTYMFFGNGTCQGTGTGAGTVTLDAAGKVPNSITESILAQGSYSFQATYSGDGNYGGSTSPCEPFTVGSGTSHTDTVVFDASTNAQWAGTETAGASAYDTATVGTSDTITATGTVTYKFFPNGTCAAGTGTGAGTVTLTASGAVPNSNTESTLAAGNYSFQATYSGDANYGGSTSPCEPFTVGAGTSSTGTVVFDASTNAPWSGNENTGSSAYDTATVGTSDTLTATGTVSYTFFPNGSCGGTGALAGTVTLTASGAVPKSSTKGPLAAGSYSFQATYSGDANYGGSTSPCEPFSLGVPSTQTATTVFDASTNAAWSGTETTGASAYDTSSVSGEQGGIVPTGTVAYTFFTNGTCAAGTGTGAGTVTLTASGAVPNSNTEHTLAQGSYSFRATYSGDGNYGGSTSPCEPFTVGAGTSGTGTVVFDAGTNAPWAGTETTGSSAYDTASVTSSDTVTATGTVSYTFFTNGSCQGTGAGAGTVSLDAAGNVPNSNTESTLAQGSYSFQATYSGDANYGGSTSPCEPFTVGAGTSSTATVVFDAATNTPWSGTETTGASAYDTATVTSSDTVTASGTVTYTFFANGSCQGTGSGAGTVMLNNFGGVPNSNTEHTLAQGSYSFQATYSGDSNYGGSTSPCEPFTVGQGTSSTATVVFDASTNGPWAGTESTGASAYDTATVGTSDTITATGTVTYRFFPNGTCAAGTGTGAGTVTLTASGAVPNSNTESTLAAGNYSFQATYSGDGNYGGSTSPCEPFTVGQGTSSTATVVFDAGTNAPWAGTESTGSSAYDTATVTSSDTVTAAGTVSYTFFTNGSCNGTGAPAGTVTLTASGAVPNSATEHTLAQGSYSFQATYSGDANYGGSTSPCEPFTVGAGTSSTATVVFDASTNAPWAGTETTGSSAYDTATVGTSDTITATGTVAYTFFANGSCQGTGTGAGTVTLDAAGNVPNSSTQHTLAQGSYSFQATYSGDGNYGGSTSPCEPFTVGGGTSHTDTVVFDASTNGPWAGTETTGASAYDTATVGTSDTITATGTVTYRFFPNGTCAAGTGTGAGTVSLDAAGNVPNSNTESTLAAGSYSFQATYSGDGNYGGSTSPCEPFSVGAGTSHTDTVVFDASTNGPWAGTESTGASAYDTATVGTSDTITATGTVTYRFFPNGTCAAGTGTGAGTVTLTASGAVPNSNTESTLAAGNYSFQATYSGDGNYGGSTSPCEPFAVGQGTSTTGTVVFDAGTKAPWTGTESTGSSAYDTATVASSDTLTATGTVSYTFFTNGSCQGNGTGAGTVMLTASGAVPNSTTVGPLAAGSYSFQATYSGDANYAGSTGPCEPFSLGVPPTQTATTVFDASTNAAWSGTETTGASAYDTSSVSGEQGGIVPTGTVTYTFFDNGSCSGGGTGAGVVSLDAAGKVPNSNTESTLAAGSYSFQATYSGDKNYGGSTSSCEPFTVGGGTSSTATTVFDASTNAPWAGTESTGSSAYDTATVTSSDTVIATGTVTYTFFGNGSCSGGGAGAGTVTLDAAGKVPNSNTEHTLAAGSYSFQATYSGDGNYSGSTSPCEPFTVGGGTSSTATTVFDAATNAAWTGNESTGAKAYDTSSVTTSDTITATGTVTYTFFTNGGCSGTGASAGKVTLTAAGAVPNSNTEGPLAAGSYSFQATYSGDTNYGGSTSPCEPFSVGPTASQTATTVFDAATNAAWSGTETTGSSAYDTAKVTGQQGIVPTGTVTYTFFTNGTCSGSGTGAGTVTLTATGAVPNSNTEHTLAAGSYAFRATYNGDSNYNTSTSSCEPFSVKAGNSTTKTVVFDASTNAPWAGTESPPASAYDTATVTTSDTVTATGTVTYTFFTNGTCSGSGTGAGTVTLTAAGGVPNSNTEGSLAAGSYSFQATYSGDSNYGGSTGPCEPFSVVGIVSQITPTQTTCAQFASGTAGTQSAITYSTKGTTISQAAPGVFFYWVKVTVTTAGKQTYNILQSTTYSPTTGTAMFAKANGSFAYNGSCGTLSTTISPAGTGPTGSDYKVVFTAPTAGTYYIGIKYTTSTIVGSGPAATKFVSPQNYLYTFSTSGVSGSSNTLALNHK
jgi:hypothetical protein